MQIQVFFLLSTCQWKKNVFHSHFQEIARKHTWQFLSKFPLSVVTFLEICAQDFSFRMKAFPLAHLFRNIWRSNLLCRILRSANHYHPHQEPIDWSVMKNAVILSRLHASVSLVLHATAFELVYSKQSADSSPFSLHIRNRSLILKFWLANTASRSTTAAALRCTEYVLVE